MHLILMVLVLVSWGLSDTSYNKCLKRPCTCCANGECTLSGDKGFYCKGCKNGYTGPTCSQSCPETCYNCSQDFFTERRCDVCKNGSYNGHISDVKAFPYNNDCSQSCREGCKSCTSYTNCTICKIGYFMKSDITCEKCSDNCAKCVSSTQCLKCKKGFYLDGVNCRRCSLGCKKCISSFSCNDCWDSYFLEGNECKQCPNGCEVCNGKTTCYRCRKGNYLSHLQCYKCPPNCNECRLNKKARLICRVCKNGYYVRHGNCHECPKNCFICNSQSNCQTCKNNYTLYNALCIKCTPPCTTCLSDNNCSTCLTGYYSMNGRCMPCADGMYGENCSFHCSLNCDFNSCEKSTGICTSCKTGYHFNKSKQCVKCPEHCIDCESNTECMTCDKGFKGETCQEECSNCKAGSRCEKPTGYCFDGCKEGFSGHNCDLFCARNCSTCLRDNPNECITCGSDRYGVACAKKCHSKCMFGRCNDIDGNCTYGCETGYWGRSCEDKCDSHCYNKTCKRYNGNCTHEVHGENVKGVPYVQIGIGLGAVLIAGLTLAIILHVKLKNAGTSGTCCRRRKNANNFNKDITKEESIELVLDKKQQKYDEKEVFLNRKDSLFLNTHVFDDNTCNELPEDDDTYYKAESMSIPSSQDDTLNKELPLEVWENEKDIHVQQNTRDILEAEDGSCKGECEKDRLSGNETEEQMPYVTTI